MSEKQFMALVTVYLLVVALAIYGLVKFVKFIWEV
jgi:hypothetical protein